MSGSLAPCCTRPRPSTPEPGRTAQRRARRARSDPRDGPDRRRMAARARLDLAARVRDRPARGRAAGMGGAMSEFPVANLLEAAPHLRRPFTPGAAKFKVQQQSGDLSWGLVVAY